MFHFLASILSTLIIPIGLYAQPNPTVHSVQAGTSEIRVSGNQIMVEPGRNIRSSEYTTYRFAKKDFYAINDSGWKGERTIYCPEASRQSRTESNQDSKMQEPSGGFKITTIDCDLSSRGLFAIHRSFFETDPETNKYGNSTVMTGRKWLVINRKGKILHEAFNYDNGPDYLSEGLYRFVRNGKMGFANESGKEVIPAKFGFIFPFEGGLAKGCVTNCRQIQDGEHTRIEAKTWVYIDKKGKQVRSKN